MAVSTLEMVASCSFVDMGKELLILEVEVLASYVEVDSCKVLVVAVVLALGLVLVFDHELLIQDTCPSLG
jgi:hypothetical protein